MGFRTLFQLVEQKANRPGGTNNQCVVIVERLPTFINERMISDMFGRFGHITELKFNDCNDAYVSYGNKRDAEQAVEGCNGRKLCGAIISAKLQRTKPASVGQQQCAIKVRCIPSHVTDEDLMRIFSSVGFVQSVHNTEHGYAYVNYNNLEDANRAVEKYDGASMYGARSVSVKIKMPSTSAPASVELPPASPLPSLPDQKPPTPCPVPSTSATLKVSIIVEKEMNLTVNDLLMALDKYGTITQHSEIKPGTPRYAYINFTTPEEARAACELNGMTLKGHYIKIKVVNKQVVNMDIREIPCDPLIGKLLLRVKETELQGITIKMAPNKTAIQISGKASEMDAIETKVKSLIENVEKDVTKVAKSLPCFHLPSFGAPLITAVINKIEDDHMVHIKVLDSSGKLLDVEDVVTQVSRILQANPENGVAEATHFSFFLHSAPLKSSQVPHGHPSSLSPAMSVGHVPSPPYTPLPPQGDMWLWYEYEKRRFTPYDEETSKKLTAHFLKEPQTPYQLHIKTGCYEINLSTMTQTNIVTTFKRKIKHVLADPSQPTYSTSRIQTIERRTAKQPPSQIRIEIQGIKTTLEAAFTNLRVELDKLVTESKVSIELVDQSKACHIIERYCVEAAVVERGLVIKGSKEYVAKVADKVMNMLQKEQSKFLDHMVPDHPDLCTRDKATLALVDDLSFEWRDVEQSVLKTLPDAKVSKLQIIQNVKLDKRYMSAKRRMCAKNGAQHVNEKYLFYVTADVPLEQIYNTTSINQWGSTPRFAVNASYSNKYAHQLGKERCLIVARVLTGRSYDCPPDQVGRKPPKPAHVGGLYDSETEVSQGSVIYVINDHENAVPAYLVSYIV